MRETPIVSMPQLDVGQRPGLVARAKRLLGSPSLKLIALILFGLIGVVLAAKVLAAFVSEPNVIAWVQALGGLLSIVGAWLIGRNGEIAAAKARDHQRRTLLESTRTCAKEAADQYERLHRAFTLANVTKDAFFRAYNHASFEALIRSLRSIPFHELGDYSIGKAILDLESVLERTMQRLDQCAVLAERVTDGGFVDTLSAMQDSTLLFNHAASVERRAAELLSERARL